MGIEVAYSNSGIFSSQHKYVLDLLNETGMLRCKPIDTSIEQNHKLGYINEEAIADRYVPKLVRKLIYLSHSRPDIAYAFTKRRSS